MNPQFQSSFIPKGPVAPTSSIPVSMGPRPRQRDFLMLLASLVFGLSVLLAIGVFGYKFYLINSVNKASAAIEDAKQRLTPDAVSEITGLNDRIVSTKTLIDSHTILTPVFNFIEAITPKTVAFTGMDYQHNDLGVTLSLEGVARDYSSLALLSDTLNKSANFKNTVFSDLNLDPKGNVSFKLTTNLDNNFISYRKSIEAVSGAANFGAAASSTPLSGSATSTLSATSSPNTQ